MFNGAKILLISIGLFLASCKVKNPLSKRPPECLRMGEEMRESWLLGCTANAVARYGTYSPADSFEWCLDMADIVFCKENAK